MGVKMKKLIRKLRAVFNRTFVADCPACHKHFYGFNDYAEHVKLENKHYRLVCHRCKPSVKNEDKVK